MMSLLNAGRFNGYSIDALWPRFNGRGIGFVDPDFDDFDATYDRYASGSPIEIDITAMEHPGVDEWWAQRWTRARAITKPFAASGTYLTDWGFVAPIPAEPAPVPAPVVTLDRSQKRSALLLFSQGYTWLESNKMPAQWWPNLMKVMHQYPGAPIFVHKNKPSILKNNAVVSFDLAQGDEPAICSMEIEPL